MRLFVAVNPGEPLRAAVATFLDSLRPLGDLKWVSPGNLHITLKFIGEQPESALPRLIGALQAASRASSGFPVGIGRIGLFPQQGRPRVLFLQMEDDRRLSLLARQIEKVLVATFPDLKMDGEYRAHLTLGRFRRECPPGAAVAFTGLPTPGFPSFAVDRFELIESRLTPAGPLYATRGVFPLAAVRGT